MIMIVMLMNIKKKDNKYNKNKSKRKGSQYCQVKFKKPWLKDRQKKVLYMKNQLKNSYKEKISRIKIKKNL